MRYLRDRRLQLCIAERLQTTVRRCARAATAVVLVAAGLSSQANTIADAHATVDGAHRTLVIAGPAEGSLDPHANNGSRGSLAATVLYDGLVRWNGSPPEIVPWLAERHEVSPDGLTHTFHLRADARFHDGTPVTAADVVYSMERLLALKGGPYPLFVDVIAPGGARIESDRVVTFGLKQPYPGFAAIVAELAVVNRALLRANERNNDWGQAWLARQAAGSGGYRLVEAGADGGFRAQRSEGHFGGRSHNPVEVIEARVVGTPTARLALIESGERAVVIGSLPDGAKARLQEAAQQTVIAAPTLRVLSGIINQRRAPGNDINLRRALLNAFDYDDMIRRAGEGALQRGGSPLPDVLWGGSDPSRGWWLDLDRSRGYLAQVKAELPELVIGSLTGQPLTEIAADVMQQGLAAIGVRSRLVRVNRETINARVAFGLGEIDVLFWLEDQIAADATRWLVPRHRCAEVGRSNRSGFCNPEVDQLLAQADSAADPAGRSTALAAAATLIEAHAVEIWIGAAARIAVAPPGVTGIRFMPYSEAIDVQAITLAGVGR